MNARKIRELLRLFEGDYAVFALRVTGKENIAPGDVLGPSRSWWEGEPVFFHKWIDEAEAGEYEAQGFTVYCDRDEWCYHNLAYMRESDFDHVIAVNEKVYKMEAGTCGILVTPDNVEQALEFIAKYKGDQRMLIAGSSGEEGYDKGEVIIPNPTVIEVWPPDSAQGSTISCQRS